MPVVVLVFVSVRACMAVNVCACVYSECVCVSVFVTCIYVSDSGRECICG